MLAGAQLALQQLPSGRSVTAESLQRPLLEELAYKTSDPPLPDKLDPGWPDAPVLRCMDASADQHPHPCPAQWK